MSNHEQPSEPDPGQPNQGIELVMSSVNTLFDIAPGNPQFGHVQVSSPSEDGAVLEGVMVPYDYAIRGFPEMADYRIASLGIRRIKNSGLLVARQIIELTLAQPFDIKYAMKGINTEVLAEEKPGKCLEQAAEEYAEKYPERFAEQYIVDDGKLFMHYLSGRQVRLEERTRDIAKPIAPGKNFKQAGEGFIKSLGQKMVSVVEGSTTATA